MSLETGIPPERVDNSTDKRCRGAGEKARQRRAGQQTEADNDRGGGDCDSAR